MEALELNVRAKPQYLLAKKKQRRNEMVKWRKQKNLIFHNKEDFDKWLDYTKWHKRPVKISNHAFHIDVEFLDYKEHA